MKKKLKLILEDGSQYLGESFGADTEMTGEVVFNTGMVGYTEGITDPSYRDQILISTYPLIGNYGVPDKEQDELGLLKAFESDHIHINGLVVSDYSENYNHHEAKKSLGDWLKEEGIPAITGIDTRGLTKKIREKGVMLGAIVHPDKTIKDIKLKDPNDENLGDKVCIKEPKIFEPKNPVNKTVLLMDCGVKNNIIRNILQRGWKVILVPWNYDFFNTEYKFDGVFISNGPGDPISLKKLIENVKKAMSKNIPVVGICMGNSVIGLASGAKTYKLKYGHRSQNQPCIDLETDRCYLTTQNHGYAIKEKSLKSGWKVWFRNANDESVEGIKHESKPYACVQFHPESTPGPTDTQYIFDELLSIIA